MSKYVTKAENGYRTADSRVPLSAIVLLFRDGESAEAIQQCYRTLTLEEVYGAIAYYLADREALDTALEEEYEAEQKAFKEWRERHPHLLRPLREAVSESSVSE